MKNKIYSINARTLFMFWGILLISIPTFAKYDYEKVKTVVEEVLVDENSIVSVYHQRGRGPLDVAYYDGDKAKIEVELRVEGDDESDLETFLSKYKIGVERLGDEVMIHSGFNIKAWKSGSPFSHGICFQ